MAASSAMKPEMVVAGVSPGMAIISKPTEQTQVIASSFSMVIPNAIALLALTSHVVKHSHTPDRLSDRKKD